MFHFKKQVEKKNFFLNKTETDVFYHLDTLWIISSTFLKYTWTLSPEQVDIYIYMIFNLTHWKTPFSTTGRYRFVPSMTLNVNLQSNILWQTWCTLLIFKRHLPIISYHMLFNAHTHSKSFSTPFIWVGSCMQRFFCLFKYGNMGVVAKWDQLVKLNRPKCHIGKKII